MPSKLLRFLTARLKSFGYAINGIVLLLKTEVNFQIQFICALAICALALVVGLSITEWILQLLAIGLVLAAEAMNSAIERLADVQSKEQNKEIGMLKDIAAAAPLMAAIIALVIGLLIYLPKIS